MIKSEPYYAVACDRCGVRADYGDYDAWKTPGDAVNQLYEDWFVVTTLSTQRHYCPSCTVWDEELEMRAVLALDGADVPADTTAASDTDALQRAIGGVLFNTSNYPERARRYIMGTSTAPLNAKLVEAILAAGFHR